MNLIVPSYEVDVCSRRPYIEPNIKTVVIDLQFEGHKKHTYGVIMDYCEFICSQFSIVTNLMKKM